jgi:hypothetical protein
MRKLLILFLALIVSLGTSIPAFAKTKEVSSYEKILNSVNKEFNLDLGYIPVDESKVSIEEYEETTRKIATQQRELLDYINMRKKQCELETAIKSTNLMAINSVTKTVKKDVWNFESSFFIEVTYNVNGTTVSSLRNASVDTKLMATIAGTGIMNHSAPSYSILDGGRTGGVSFRANIYFNNGTVNYTNVLLYCEVS